MSDRGEGGPRGPRGPSGKRGRGGPNPKKRGGLRLSRLGGNDFELDHPRCVDEMELDYAEGIELWKSGDVEAARDALRYALQGCGDNLWVHVALGRIALEEFKDPSLARGHFGYAVELAQRTLPPGFSGRLPRQRLANQPFFDALEGLATCYEALGKAGESKSLRALVAKLAGEPGEPKESSQPGRRPPGVV